MDVVLCEDTRRTGLLITNKFLSYYDEIEDKRIPEVIELLQTKNVALVSDAGTPLISDPGFRLVRECIKRHIKVESIPGPSAILAALTSSGLPPDKFIFLGFFDKKNLSYVQKGMTVIFYCAPHKFFSTIDDLRSVFGDIDIVVARELTKVHEEIWRGSLCAARDYFRHPKGEMVILFSLAR